MVCCEDSPQSKKNAGFVLGIKADSSKYRHKDSARTRLNIRELIRSKPEEPKRANAVPCLLSFRAKIIIMQKENKVKRKSIFHNYRE